MITDIQKEKIRGFAARRPIELVYLLGSHATGEEKPYSDYDIAILFSESLASKARFQEKLEAISFLSQLFGTDKVDVIDLADASPALRYEAIAPRENVYTKEESVRVNFEKRSLSEYFDRIYYIKRHTSISLPTIARDGLAK